MCDGLQCTKAHRVLIALHTDAYINAAAKWESYIVDVALGTAVQMTSEHCFLILCVCVPIFVSH